VELRIDASSAVPLYAQVVEQIRTLVAMRALRQGDQLPSVRELATSLRINRNTAAKAYQLLESMGVLESRAGQGTFVADNVVPWSDDERQRRLENSLERALVEAYHLEIPFEEIPAVLERVMKEFEARGNAPDGGATTLTKAAAKATTAAAGGTATTSSETTPRTAKRRDEGRRG
jgi:DNA-binding transcriptional regulator YhcF (GntR family)